MRNMSLMILLYNNGGCGVMKKLSYRIMGLFVLSAVFLSLSFSVCAQANIETNETVISKNMQYFDDGSFVIITLTEDTTASAHATTYSKSGSKHYVFYNEEKVELWRFTVHGTFSINPGISSTCTADSYSVNISDKSWQNESASSYKSGNQSVGDATFIQKYLFITIKVQDCHVTLSCDSNGNLS